MRPSPAALRPTDVGILLSYACQSGCAHCLYNCGPGWKDWIDPAGLEQCLRAAAGWEHAFQVHFTGGEPFLNFPVLLKAVQLATQLGIPSYVETNAAWCLNETHTREQFQLLRDAGMGAVMVSCSPFHAEHIPLERTLRAVSAAVDIFGLQRVWVYRSDWIQRIRAQDTQKPVPLERYGGEAGRLLWDDYGLLGGGRAGYRLGHLTRRHAPERFQWENCRLEILHAPHAHFDLYGNVIPAFCGGIRLGDWHDLDRLNQQLAYEEYPPLASILIDSGAYGLYRMARDQYDYQVLPEGYADKCHLCVDVRRYLFNAGRFDELAPGRFYDFTQAGLFSPR